LQGDIILEFNGEKLTADNTLREMIYNQSPGDVVDMKVLRDGEEMTLQATLEEWEG